MAIFYEARILAPSIKSLVAGGSQARIFHVQRSSYCWFLTLRKLDAQVPSKEECHFLANPKHFGTVISIKECFEEIRKSSEMYS